MFRVFPPNLGWGVPWGLARIFRRSLWLSLKILSNFHLPNLDEIPRKSFVSQSFLVFKGQQILYYSNTLNSKTKRRRPWAPPFLMFHALCSMLHAVGFFVCPESTSYLVFCCSKKFTSSKTSVAVLIHLAGLVTLYSFGRPNSVKRRSATYWTYWFT